MSQEEVFGCIERTNQPCVRSYSRRRSRPVSMQTSIQCKLEISSYNLPFIDIGGKSVIIIMHFISLPYTKRKVYLHKYDERYPTLSWVWWEGCRRPTVRQSGSTAQLQLSCCAFTLFLPLSLFLSNTLILTFIITLILTFGLTFTQYLYPFIYLYIQCLSQPGGNEGSSVVGPTAQLFEIWFNYFVDGCKRN